MLPADNPSGNGRARVSPATRREASPDHRAKPANATAAPTSTAHHQVRATVARPPPTETEDAWLTWTTADMSCDQRAISAPPVIQAPTVGGAQNAPRMAIMPMASAATSSPAMTPAGWENVFPRVTVVVRPAADTTSYLSQLGRKAATATSATRTVAIARG